MTLKTGAGWLAVVLFGGVDTRMNLHRAVRKAKVGSRRDSGRVRNDVH